MRGPNALETISESTPIEGMMMDWQPISEAPKDGTRIIGLTQYGALEIWWHRGEGIAATIRARIAKGEP